MDALVKIGDIFLSMVFLAILIRIKRAGEEGARSDYNLSAPIPPQQ
jgi:hypothetical protein